MQKRSELASDCSKLSLFNANVLKDGPENAETLRNSSRLLQMITFDHQRTKESVRKMQKRAENRPCLLQIITFDHQRTKESVRKMQKRSEMAPDCSK